jgi:hypothetical protein
MSRFVFAVVAGVGVAVILAPASPQPSRERKAEEKAKMSAKDLLDVARRGLALAERTGPLRRETYDWSRRVLDAELGLCATAEERIAARERYLARAEKLERGARALLEGGAASKADLVEAEYHRCEAAVQLEAERSARRVPGSDRN